MADPTTAVANDTPLSEKRLRCSFCGKSKDSVPKFISGPGPVYICSDCIALCNEILAGDEEPVVPTRPNIKEIADWFSEDTEGTSDRQLVEYAGRLMDLRDEVVELTKYTLHVEELLRCRPVAVATSVPTALDESGESPTESGAKTSAPVHLVESDAPLAIRRAGDPE